MYIEKVIIERTYIADISDYFNTQGKQLQETVDNYINVMNRVVVEGIASGETSDSIFRFLTYAEQLKHVISDTSSDISRAAENYLEEIQEQERYYY